MSILSWFTCGCLLSIPAFFMARSELAAIDRGEVGANNRGNAQAAYWLAAINAGLCLLFLGMYLLAILFAIGVSPR